MYVCKDLLIVAEQQMWNYSSYSKSKNKKKKEIKKEIKIKLFKFTGEGRGVKSIQKQEWSLSVGQPILVCVFVGRYSSMCDFPSRLRS